jgi:hypothetical protein
MAEIKIKSNGLRNELKEIRKSIDKLTGVLIDINTHQTNKRYESINSDTCCNDVKLCKCKKNKSS